jgi:hypothetical protein
MNFVLSKALCCVVVFCRCCQNKKFLRRVVVLFFGLFIQKLNNVKVRIYRLLALRGVIERISDRLIRFEHANDALCKLSAFMG